MTCDTYLQLVIDSVKDSIMKHARIEDAYTELHTVLLLARIGLKRSPYNYDFQTNLQIAYYYLSNFEKLSEITQVMDVKGVQWDTIGYWINQSILTLNNFENDSAVDSALLFY